MEGVSDAGLQRDLAQLLAGGCRTEARIVAHLAEVERRSLFLKEGFSALFKYCVRRLGLSENEAFHRMTAARIAGSYPVVFGMIELRKIHLSGLCLLRDFLTRENHLELLEAASGKTKKQVLELLAARFPGRKVADSVRRRPRSRIAAVIASKAGAATVLATYTSKPTTFATCTGAASASKPATGKRTRASPARPAEIRSTACCWRALPTCSARSGWYSRRNSPASPKRRPVRGSAPCPCNR